MASSLEESTPLLAKKTEATDDKKTKAENQSTHSSSWPASELKSPPSLQGGGYGWMAAGVPLPSGHRSVVGEPMRRTQWDSGLFSCFGRSDEFCSSDLEVCLLGSVAPCVLYGSNAERLGSVPGTFSNHCLTYTGLYLIGNSCFGYNCMAPLFSYPTRTAIRRKFNLEGSCEALDRTCGCCGIFMEDKELHEQWDSACDFATHVFCHTCALCQEGRELRRRVPHPGIKAQPVMVMIPPLEQSMSKSRADNMPPSLLEPK